MAIIFCIRNSSFIGKNRIIFLLNSVWMDWLFHASENINQMLSFLIHEAQILLHRLLFLHGSQPNSIEQSRVNWQCIKQDNWQPGQRDNTRGSPRRGRVLKLRFLIQHKWKSGIWSLTFPTNQVRGILQVLTLSEATLLNL